MSMQIQTYNKYPLTITKGSGSYVWDSNNKQYLDFYGGHAVCIIGHCPKPVTSSIAKQSQKLIFYSNIVHTQPGEELANLLSKTLNHKYKVYFTNSGSEANESAIKMARKITNKKNIISFHGAFHGRSITSLAATGITSYKVYKPNLQKHTKFATFGDIKSVKAAYNKDTAAIICEPIQSIAGIKTANKKFFHQLAKFCQEKGIILIFDEVQTGLGRSGKFWYCQKLGIQPDIITTAKGLASGLPISAVLVKDSLAKKIKPGEHATTFGGGPLVCSAAISTIQEVQKHLPKVEQKHQLIKNELQKIDLVEQVTGEGLLIGIKLKNHLPELIKTCLKEGLIIGSSKDPQVLRLMPPLNITKKEIKEFSNKFKNALNKCFTPELEKQFYIQKFQNKIFVIKISGDIIKNKTALTNIIHNIKELHDLGIKIVLIHGGGIQADEIASKLGHTPQKIDGRRITTDKDLEIIKMVFGGSTNLEILSAMKKSKLKGIRVSGMDGNLLEACLREKTKIDFGHVGDIKKVNPEILTNLINQGYIPVISPLASCDEGKILNINADTIASEIAISLKAEKVILMSKTSGIIKEGKTISYLDQKLAKKLIKDKIITNGMHVKIETCLKTIANGIKRVQIINGLKKDALINEVLSKKGTGTMVVSQEEKEIYLNE